MQKSHWEKKHMETEELGCSVKSEEKQKVGSAYSSLHTIG